MITPEMLEYIKRQQQAGKSREEIIQALHEAGWQESDIQAGLNPEQHTVTGQTATPLPPAMDILKKAWEIYQRKFWLLIGISALPAALALVGAMFFGGGAVLAGKTAPHISSALGAGGLALAFVFLIIIIYVGVWSSVAEIVAIRDHTENLAFKETFTRARPFISQFFFTNLLTGLAIMVGFVLLIVPGIIFALWFSQTAYIVICEKLYYTTALKKSKSYVNGRLWEVFTKYLLIGVVVYGSVILTSFIPLLSNVLSFALAPLMLVYAYVLYQHLKGQVV